MKKAIFTLLTVLFLSTIYFAQERPGIAYPFTSEDVKIVSERGTIQQPNATEAVNDASFLSGANYLKKAQADVTEDNAGNGNPDTDPNDGGWDWSSTVFTHSVSASPTNIYGATAQGLYYAYLESNDPTYMTAMLDAANVMIGDPGIKSAADVVFLMKFQDLVGVTADIYKDAAKAKFDARIATYTDATGLAVYIRDFRAASYENGIIPWDIGTWAVAAQMLEDRYPADIYDYAQAADDIAEVLYQDSYLQNPGYFDLTTNKNNGWDPTYTNTDYYWYTLGITGLIDAFNSADVHTDKLADLTTILLDCQYSDGAFSYSYGANTDDQDWQSTAYSVLSLANLDQATYQTDINYACYWTTLTQDPASGGWVYSSGSHYPEIGGENTAALYFGAKPANVYVDDDWAGSSNGDVVGGYLFGYDAFDNIQDAIAAVEGSTVNVAAGTYTLSQTLIDKNVLIQGAGKGVTQVSSDYNTASSGHSNDASAWIRTAPGYTVDISDLTFDATGFDTYTALRFKSSGTVTNVVFNEIKHSASPYIGIAVQVQDGNVDVTNCDFTNIGRIGVHYRAGVIPGAVISGTYDSNTYNGKGVGDWLDYALDISGATTLTVSNSAITNNLGVASTDGSTSGGVLATTYYPAGLNMPNSVLITNCELTNNTTGIAVGFDAADVSSVVANNNNISGNTSFGVSSTAPAVDATNNWWGDASGPSGFGPGTGDAVSDFVNFDPWTVQLQVTAANTTYSFPSVGVEIVFTTLPVGGGTVTVDRYNSVPAGYPVPPAGASHVGLWLDITSSMPNYSFSANVTVDVTGLGFDASTSIMYFNSTSNTWVAVNNGTYAPGPPEIYTFTTNHFTPFSFINTPATAYNIYLASSPTATASSIIYPNDAWAATGSEPNDWGFTTPIDLYIVPETGSFFGSAELVLQWDNTLYTFAGVDESGGLFDGISFQFLYNQLGTVDQVTINASRLDNNNFTTVSGDFICKLQLNVEKPGFGPIDFTSMDFRTLDGVGGQEGVYVVGNGAAVKSYLGDVTAPSDESTGDGLVDFDDLTVWSSSYWSGVPGFAGGMTNYKVKYDVGPTADNTVYTLPTVDGMIQFEDMVIFAISYGLSGDFIYPKTAPAPETPVELIVGEPMYVGSETLVPLSISGTVVDVRAMELAFSGSFGKLLGVEKGALLQNFDAPVVLMDKSTANSANVDMAIFGANVEGLNAEGEILTLRFEGRADVQLSSASVRNSGNNSMKIEISNSNISAIPTSFALDQNYPNPFNPSTIISFQLPEQRHVSIAIFNMLGEEVSTLVNEVKEAGYHKVEWSGTNLTSGVYFYRIEAGDFVSVKKMMLMK